MSQSTQSLFLRLADEQDVLAIKTLMQLSIGKLQSGFLSPEQISASHAIMGLDTRLISDGTYFCVYETDNLVGCGGWSFRETLYGGNHSEGRNPRRLDPKTERARIRAMYTHPEHTRRGIGRMILQASEKAAFEAGFREMEMAATLAGQPLYKKCGYHEESRWLDESGAVAVPLLTMVKLLAEKSR